MNKRIKAIFSLAFLVVTLVINTIGALGLINGLDQKTVSDKYMTLITPAPLAFSIWSIIYPLLIITALVMIFKSEDEYYGKIIDSISPLFWISSVFNILWIVAFSYEQIGISVILILGALISLALILQKLRAIPAERKYLIPVTFGLYGGWLFVAVVVNIAAFLVSLGWNGFGWPEAIWAIVIMAVAVILVIGVALKNRNVIFPLPVAWAYFGIFLQQSSIEDSSNALKAFAVIFGIVLVLISAIILLMNKYKFIGYQVEEKETK